MVADVRKAFHQIRIDDCQRNFFDENPSDIGSRGALPSELLNNILWWRGPPWIERGKEYWPQTNAANLEPDDECLKEIKKIDLLQDPTIC